MQTGTSFIDNSFQLNAFLLGDKENRKGGTITGSSQSASIAVRQDRVARFEQGEEIHSDRPVDGDVLLMDSNRLVLEFGHDLVDGQIAAGTSPSQHAFDRPAEIDRCWP